MYTLLLLLIAVSSTISSQILPSEFFGTFKLDHAENFEEYLKAKGYNWITRKVVALTPVTKEILRTADPRKFDYNVITFRKTLRYEGVELGKEFTGEGIDSTKHRIRFYMKDGVLYEHHIPTEAHAVEQEDTYEWIIDGDFIRSTVYAGDLVARRYYKRV